MADLTYNVDVNTTQAQSSLQKLQTTVSGTQAAFSKLNTVIGALAIGAAVRSAITYADAIQDIADATGLAIESITGFTRAVELNGGNADSARQAILRLNQSVGGAAEGSKAAQDAFLAVGVTLQDLATLSDQDLFDKTLKGLGAIADSSKRATVQNELYGKSLRGVNLPGVANQYGAATRASLAYADSIRQAAELQNKLDIAFGQFRLAVLKSLQPLAEFINQLEPAQIEKFVDALVKLGGLAAGIFALSRAVEGLAKVLAVAAGALALATVGAASLAKTGTILGSQWGYATRAFQSASGVLAKLGQVWITVSTLFTKRLPFIIGGFARLIPLIGGVIAVGLILRDTFESIFDQGPIDYFAGKLEGLITNYFPALADMINRAGKAMGMAPPPSQQTNPEKAKKDAEDAKKREEAQLKTRQETEKLNRAIEDGYAKQRKEIQAISGEFERQLKNTRESLQVEKDSIGVSEQQRQLNQVMGELRAREREEVEKLTKAMAALSEEELKRGFGQEYQAQIDAVTRLAEAEKARLEALTQGIATEKAAFEFRLFSRQQEYDLTDKLEALERERANLGLSEIEKKYKDIQNAADDSAKAAIRAEEARRGGVKLSQAEIDAYYERAREGNKELERQTGELYERSRQFSTGWGQAFRTFADDANNAAKQADQIFNTLTKGLEDIFVDFAKTGRLSFRSLINGIVEDLLRSQVRQLIAQTFSIMGSGGGGGGGRSGGLFGGALIPGYLANGGPALSNKPYIVGERGPELFVPNTSGTVVPNQNLGGGVTNVTYNISAVDAPSFQALVARDPGFIHAVAMQGSKNMPQSRR